MPVDDLYRRVVLDHFRNPRNQGELPDASGSATRENLTCGDRIEIHVRVCEGRLEALKFVGKGCAISIASASLMSDMASGRQMTDVLDWIENFLMVMAQKKAPKWLDQHGDLAALSGVLAYPVRVKCASLAWEALQEVLQNQQKCGL